MWQINSLMSPWNLNLESRTQSMSPACMQEANLVDHAMQKWVPVFTKTVETQASHCIRQLRKSVNTTKVACGKYKFQSELLADAEKLLDEAMIMISEALLARAMTLKQPAHEVQGQLRRMHQQGIGQVCQPLLTAANKVARGG